MPLALLETAKRRYRSHPLCPEPEVDQPSWLAAQDYPVKNALRIGKYHMI
jgi:hypothetical protein